jgi:hypothetical protein
MKFIGALNMAMVRNTGIRFTISNSWEYAGYQHKSCKKADHKVLLTINL